MDIPSMDRAPGAIEPYSQGYEVDGVVYILGQIPVNPVDGTVAEGIAARAKQSRKNVGAALEVVGTGLGRVFKTTCLLIDTNNFGMSNEVHAKYLASKPARSCVAVKTLLKGVLCEIKTTTVKQIEREAGIFGASSMI